MDRVIYLDNEGRLAKRTITIPDSGSDPLPVSQRDDDGEARKSAMNATSIGSDIVQVQLQEAQDAANADRNIGDFAVYKYYFASLGWLSLLLFALFVSSDSAFSAMQCKFLLIANSTTPPTLTITQMPGSSCGQTVMIVQTLDTGSAYTCYGLFFERSVSSPQFSMLIFS